MGRDSTREAERRPAAGLEARPVRRYRTLAFQLYVLSAILGFSALAFLASTAGHFALDLAITRALQSFRSPAADLAMRAVSFFGYSPQAVVLVAGSGALLYALGLRREGLVASLVGFLASLLAALIKVVIARPRPGEDLVEVLRSLPDFGFPSGHVVFYTAFFGFLFFLSYSLLRRSFLRSLLLVVFGGLVLLVGLSRIYLGVHWASDALAGYLLGSLVLLGTIAVYRTVISTTPGSTS
jgi:undecaprenyl-diphosphatase